MDFLNQAYAQISQLFNSMTVGARITAGLLLAVVVVSLGYLFNQQTSGPDDYLLGGEPIPASQIPAMEAAFAQAGLTDYRVDGTRIRVPRGQASAYMGALADGDALPPNFDTYLTKALKGSMFESNEVYRQRIKNATQQQLSAIITAMSGIQAAMVMYDEKDQPGIKRGKIITASVNVQPMGSAPLDADRVPALKNIVASAIAGLDAKLVSVTDLNSGRNYGPAADEDTEGIGLYQRTKRGYEEEYQGKIRERLAMIPNALVAVNVELTPELSSESEERKFDPKPVAVEQESITETEQSESGAPGGRPGAAAQAPTVGGPGSGPVSLAGGNSQTTSRDVSNEKSISKVGERVEVTKTAGLVPQKVKVSVGIPNDYLRKVHERLSPGEEITPEVLSRLQSEERKRVERMIATLIPQRIDSDSKDLQRKDITITFYEDIVERAVIEVPSTSSQALSWFGQNLSTLSLSLLAIVGMVMLRSVVKGGATPPSGAAATAVADTETPISEPPAVLPFPTEEELDEEEQAEHVKRLKRRLSAGPSVKDELAELVKEDPDAAATILKTWISNAG
ncbi:MAG: hypothetical protein DWQ31_17820 [Planctomycetota bacterium]|nr:MAG: hypothetical protein DWQ31_17820 [Planctomycetota bacterium]REJ94389.1 MAG: hypothetical protein DWQ35_08300 [Planctomycetota bacterium]REK22078.1 MAG: hypothetical protein DWQ42_18225 [Planctomycetota bacterium]REK44486.1 MAG: hypothetical protein DWQ46_09510 [Planctomycetota bacterium]